MIELRREGRVLRIGHRGAAALAPENTLRSLELAIELGVDLVEFDVIDVRGTLVLAHSTRLAEITHGSASGRVRRRTLAELRELAPDLPTLDDALSFLGERDVGLHLDFKCRGRESDVVEALRRHGLVERTVVSSFSAGVLRALRSLEPGLQLGLTYPRDRSGLGRRPGLAPVTAGVATALRRALPRRIVHLLGRAGASAAMLHYAVVSRAAVERCHDGGAAVFAWTVDEPALAERLDQLGIDGVITNDPRIFGAQGADSAAPPN